MTKKRRLNLRVQEGEMALVGPIEQFHHLVDVYEGLAEMYPENQEGWLELAAWVREWIERTARSEQEWESTSSFT